MTLTDYALTLLCTWFSLSLWKVKSRSVELRILWVIFFSSVAFAALVGGTVHGFFINPTSVGYQILWPATLLAIGVTASVSWIISGAMFSKSKTALRKWIYFAIAVFVVYTLVVLFYSQEFLVVIINYLPPMIALFIACMVNFTKAKSRFYLLIAVGILFGFIAAFIQQAGIAIHPIYFNHNSTYHLIQAFGLFALYKGALNQLIAERVS